MKVTHYLEIHNAENDCEDVCCLTDKTSGVNIIFGVLQRRQTEKYFITFKKLLTGEDEKIHGLYTSGNMYSASDTKKLTKL